MKINYSSVIKLKLHFLFISFCILPVLSYSQENIKPEIDYDISSGKMKSRAEHALKTGDVYTALFYYEQITQKDSNDLESKLRLAELYKFSRNYTKAEEVYDNVYQKSPSKYPFALFYKGQMQKMNGKYEDAKANMLSFKKSAGNIGDRDFKALLAKEIAGCDSGIVFKEFPESIIINNAGDQINQPHTEFSPVLLDSNTLLFGSLRMETLKYYNVSNDHYEQQPVRQIFKAEKVNGSWESKGLDDQFNDPNMDMGNFVYSECSNRYYFTKCHKDVKGHVHCKIYYTENENGKWSHPKALPHPINIEGYSSTQPAIVQDTITAPRVNPKTKVNPTDSKNKKQPSKKVTPQQKVNNIEYLYFVSDRPGGKGGLDIWYTYYNPTRKEWVTPANFVYANTPETECTPYFHKPTQTLYFSSNGQTTAGGLDVFKTQKDGNKFSKPQNLSFPVNSPQDDINFTLDKNGRKGMLVSNRPGGTPYFHETCCDDIFAFEMVEPKPFNCTLLLAIKDEQQSECKDQELLVSVLDVKTKKERKEKIIVKDCKHQFPLEKNQIYTFTVSKEGYQNDTLIIHTRDMASTDYLDKQIILKSNAKKEPVVIEKPVEGVAFVLKDIQYEINEVQLTATAKNVLDSVLVPFLNSHPEDIVIISSHTDDKGSHKYNHQLSQQRADNVVKYLVSKGIKINRLQAKGYGETKPIAPNSNPDGSDNPFGRGINRRTEFLFLKPNAKPTH